MKQEYVEDFPIGKLEPHPENPRRGDVPAIADSIKHHGFYGAILVQKSRNRVIAGNHRYKAAMREKHDTLPVFLLDVDDDQARRILLVDNRTNDVAGYDDPTLIDLLQFIHAERGDLDGTGYTEEDLQALLDEAVDGEADEGPYTRKVISPIYEPTGERPDVTDLKDDTRAQELKAEIEEADIPEDVRAFLRAAAERHTRFDYGNIAEFYAHAEPEVQSLMEQSALVIIDFDQAIEQGFVRLNEDVAALFRKDHPDA